MTASFGGGRDQPVGGIVAGGEIAPFEGLVQSLRTQGMPSVRNLLVTIFGDSVRPQGVAVSVRSLATLLEPLDVSERLVRTSLTRLATDEWVAAERIGHRSFYGVHPAAANRYERAERRIYHRDARTWDGAWTVAVVDGNVGRPDERAALRRELAWVGMGSVAPNVMASPVVDAAAVAEIVAEVGPPGAVHLSTSTTITGTSLVADVDLARRAVPLDDLAARYGELIGWFEPFTTPSSIAGLTPAQAFVVRTLLIAAYRRIVLVDPLLPDELLPQRWNGEQAFGLVGGVYESLLPATDDYFADVVETAPGTQPGRASAGRFAQPS